MVYSCVYIRRFLLAFCAVCSSFLLFIVLSSIRPFCHLFVLAFVQPFSHSFIRALLRLSKDREAYICLLNRATVFIFLFTKSTTQLGAFTQLLREPFSSSKQRIFVSIKHRLFGGHMQDSLSKDWNGRMLTRSIFRLWVLGSETVFAFVSTMLRRFNSVLVYHFYIVNPSLFAIRRSKTCRYGILPHLPITPRIRLVIKIKSLNCNFFTKRA